MPIRHIYETVKSVEPAGRERKVTLEDGTTFFHGRSWGKLLAQWRCLSKYHQEDCRVLIDFSENDGKVDVTIFGPSGGMLAKPKDIPTDKISAADTPHQKC